MDPLITFLIPKTAEAASSLSTSPASPTDASLILSSEDLSMDGPLDPPAGGAGFRPGSPVEKESFDTLSKVASLEIHTLIKAAAFLTFNSLNHPTIEDEILNTKHSIATILYSDYEKRTRVKDGWISLFEKDIPDLKKIYLEAYKAAVYISYTLPSILYEEELTPYIANFIDWTRVELIIRHERKSIILNIKDYLEHSRIAAAHPRDAFVIFNAAVLKKQIFDQILASCRKLLTYIDQDALKCELHNTYKEIGLSHRLPPETAEEFSKAFANRVLEELSRA